MSGEKPLKSRIAFVVVFALVIIMLLPVYLNLISDASMPRLKALYKSIGAAIEYYKFKGDYGVVAKYIDTLPDGLARFYTVFSDVLLVLSPIVTIGFILSFFYAVRASRNIFMKRKCDTYVFSCVNERSLSLAKSIRENHPKALVIFCDATTEELRTKGRKYGQCLKRNVVAFNGNALSKTAQMYFFIMGDSEKDNLETSLKIIRKYAERDNTRLYSFVSGTESELLLSDTRDSKVIVRRVNDAKSLIYRFLYNDGVSIFKNAIDNKIVVAICGVGVDGMEILKALPWFCQMDGYDVEIHAFDKDPNLKERFTAACPELMDDMHNGTDIKGESRYKISIHEMCDVSGKTFADSISAINGITEVFVCLGDDERNISCATYARTLLERKNLHPEVRVFINEEGKKDRIEKAVSHDGKSYDIKCISAPEIDYTEDVIINSELEKDALERHLKWGDDESFWAYEFNYNSSCASAIGIKMRKLLEITDENTLKETEHKRWNAYMRSEGYVYSGSRDRFSRSTIGKMHPDLVPYDMLSSEDKKKDF